uniref:SAM domain-containing protein n=2 Tax=Periophthalmus magnuspinnatus TaxID=409849 RepID=A0A3B4A544_9GOBI
MTTSPHSNNSINHNNNHISHTNSITHNNSLSHGNTQTEGVAQQRVQRRASAPAVTSTFRPAPSQWSVEEVTAFINTLPGCGDVAEAFRVQEIDGQALLLLTEDHLMTSMNIKLGPALKICAHINSLKNQ